MDRKADILILGGGIMGLSVAYYASKMGLGKITILDRGRVGRGASSRNSSVVRETYAEESMIRITQMGITLWEGLSKELHWNLLFDQKGHVAVLRSDGHYNSAKANIAIQNRLGVRSTILSPDQTLSLVPFLEKESILGAVYHRRGGSIHHDAALWAFEKAVRAMGVEIVEGVECEKVTSTGGRVSGASTTAGEVIADKVVVATGMRSIDLYLALGVRLPIRALKREAMVTEPYKRIIRPVLTDRSAGLLLNQTLRGEIVIDDNQEGGEDWRGLRSSYSFAKQVSADVCRLYPPLQHIRFLRQWAGEYDLTPDRGPILGGAAPLENLYLAAGFSGHGFMMAPAIGTLFAEMLSTGGTPELVKRFNIARFEKQVRKDETASGTHTAAPDGNPRYAP